MPFSKWNLEPVYVSRTPPWHQQQQNGVLHHPKDYHNLPNQPSNEEGGNTSVKTKIKSVGGDFHDPPPLSLPLPQLPGGKKQKHHHKRSENDENLSPNSAKSTSEVNSHSHSSSSSNVLVKSSTSPAIVNDSSADNNEEESSTTVVLTPKEAILLKVSCRSLVGVIRQMAALLGASDQLMAEITDECRRLADRTVALRARVVRLSGTVDRANAALRQNPPKIHNLMAELDVAAAEKQQLLADFYARNPFFSTVTNRINGQQIPINYLLPSKSAVRRVHWRSATPLDRDLLRPETRPLAVRNVYARAHAPGDLRLASHCHSDIGYPSPYITMLRNLRNGGGQQGQSLLGRKGGVTSDRQHQCQCDCGQCHHLNQQEGNLVNHKDSCEVKDTNKCVQMTTSEECSNTQNGITSNRNSSPSSLVTWSSVVSSSAFESSMAAFEHQDRKKPGGGKLYRRSLLSSFSSADYAEEEEEEEASTDPKTKIDDFFRKNNVSVDQNESSNVQKPVKSKCTCSCRNDESSKSNQLINYQPIITDDDEMTSITDVAYSQVTSTNQTAGGDNRGENHSTTTAHSTDGSTRSLIHRNGSPSFRKNLQNGGDDIYWNWWWSDDEHRRWSSAMSSPLKPAKVENEMSVWLRENIETRRPESVVFKSASDVPNHVLLERALSPPCSSHSIVLRPKKKTSADRSSANAYSEDEGVHSGARFSADGNSSTLPRLKRRWSLFPMRRKQTKSMVISGPTLVDPYDQQNDPNFFSRSSRNRQSLPPNSITDQHRTTVSSSLEGGGGGEDSVENLDDNKPVTEVLLMSPEERVQLLANQFSSPVLVNIDTSGKQFQKMSSGRRSLIHYDFHIPRRHVPVRGRSRSKSPVKNTGTMTMNMSSSSNSKEVSPYALSGRLPDHHRGTISRPKPVTERGCQTESGGGHNEILSSKLSPSFSDKSHQDLAPSKGGNRYQVTVDVHHLQHQLQILNGRQGPFQQNDDDPESDDYVTLMRKSQKLSGNCQQHLNNDTFSITTSNSELIGNNWRKAVSGSNQTVTVRYRDANEKEDPQTAKNRLQNGGRSSSGNWSAATSDLLQSSSTSSSPLHPLMSSSSRKKPSWIVSKNNKEKKEDSTVENSTSISVTQHQNNDEAESVYSVDNDGYFTSMHTDSGLFFGHTPMTTLDLQTNRNDNDQLLKLSTTSQKKRSDIVAHRLRFDRKVLSKRFERIQEEVVPNGKVVVNSNGIPEQLQNFGGSNESINSILSNSDATSVAVDEEEVGVQGVDNGVSGTEAGDGMMLLSPMDDTEASSSMADFDCSVSHCSHQFSHHSHRGNGRILGHRAHHRAELEEKRRLTAAAIRMMHQRQNSLPQNKNYHQNEPRLRTVSGTFEHGEEDDDETLRSSSSCSNGTLNGATTADDEHHQSSSYHHKNYHHQHFDTTRTRVKRSSSYRSANYGGAFRSATLSLPKSSQNPSVDQQQQNLKAGSKLSTNSPSSNSTSALRRQVSNCLTESGSSASSSYRRLPPPPPPPRVSSMLVKLQQYRDDDEARNFQKGQRPQKVMANDNGHRQSAEHEHELDFEDLDLDSIVSTETGGDKGNADDMSDLASNKSSSVYQNYHHHSYHHRPLRNGGPPSETPSDQMSTNSEYLRRRRHIFDRLDVVDSARSYPPLSYIEGHYDEFDEVQSSVQGSEVDGGGGDKGDLPFVDPSERSKANSELTKSEDTLCDLSATSSRTVTPVGMLESGLDSKDDQAETGSNFGTLERKQLEERHLSSPLPQPKLASLAHMRDSPRQSQSPKSSKTSPNKTNSQNQTLDQQSSSTPPKPKPRNSLIFSSESPPSLKSFSKETEPISPKSPKTVSKNSTSILKFPPHSYKKQVTISLSQNSISSKTTNNFLTDSSHSPQSITNSTSTSSSSTSSPPLQISPSGNSTSVTTNRRLTTEDLFIILHNQKKKLNIKTEPTLFTSTRSPPPASFSNSNSPLISPVTSPTKPQQPNISTIINPTYGQLGSPQSPSRQVLSATSSLKRRSWTENASLPTRFGNNGGGQLQNLSGTITSSGVPRTRQSLALDRLGPMRPTTLSDFKRLLANVRPPSGTTTAVSGSFGNTGLLSPGKTSNSGNSFGSGTQSFSSNSSATSTYSALQQLLKGGCQTAGDDVTSNSTNSNSTSSSSGVSSLLSPLSPIGNTNSISSSSSLLSPLSPTSLSSMSSASPFGSPARQNLGVGSNLGSNNMSDFIKKFNSKSSSKSSSMISNGLPSSPSRVSAVVRLEATAAKTSPVSTNSTSTVLSSCPPILEADTEVEGVHRGSSEALIISSGTSQLSTSDSMDSAVDLSTSQLTASCSEVAGTTSVPETIEDAQKKALTSSSSTDAHNQCTSTWV